VIFLGDIAVPNEVLSRELQSLFRSQSQLFGRDAVIANLEGLLSDMELIHSRTPVLYNHISVLKALQEANIRAVMLANNHTLDLPKQFKYTRQKLLEVEIKCAGAGDSQIAAAEPVLVKEGETEVIIFNYCWDFLLNHQMNPSSGIFVAEIEENEIVLQIAKTRENCPQAVLVVYFHWSFDLETIPFPLYRKFSQELIDRGVDVVVGCHSHCIQGGEKYKNGYIVYGLGNFYIPNGSFANGHLIFPAWARDELVFQLNLETKEATCHWYEYQQKGNAHKLLHRASERFEDSKRLKTYTPYSGMEHEVYIAYYKQNRRKRFLIPVFTNHRYKRMNRLKTRWLKARSQVARALAKLKIIRWQS